MPVCPTRRQYFVHQYVYIVATVCECQLWTSVVNCTGTSVALVTQSSQFTPLQKDKNNNTNKKKRNSGGRPCLTRQSFSTAPVKNLPCDLAGGKTEKAFQKKRKMSLKENIVLSRVLFPRQGHRAAGIEPIFTFSLLPIRLSSLGEIELEVRQRTFRTCRLNTTFFLTCWPPSFPRSVSFYWG